MMLLFLITFTARESKQARMQTQTDLYKLLTYTDSEFNPDTPERYSLEVSIAAHQLTFTIHNGLRVMGLRCLTTKHNLLENGALQLPKDVEQMEWYKPDYRQVRVFIDDNRFTLIPEPLFESDKAASYLNLVHKKISNEQILTTRLAQHSAVCVFGLNTALYRTIQSVFNAPVITHQNSILLQAASHYNGNDLKNHLLVNIAEGFVSVLYYLNGEIKFMNTFAIEADTDLVYYLLSVATLLKIPAEKSGVILMGDISLTSATMSLLKKYIPQVLTANRLENVQYPISFREFNDHQHYLAIHSLLCE
jgi:hypothetical protein